MSDSNFSDWTIRAFCHTRVVEEQDRVSVFRGDVTKKEDVVAAMKDITHVVHLATSKETPTTIIDVAIKGLFWLLEEAKSSQTLERFVLIGGDASIGHCFYPQSKPVTEEAKHQAYPGCYALSKVLEEVMLEQYQIQYNLPSVCLRAPWIMEKDDFRYALRFDKTQFGGPLFADLIGEDKANSYQKRDMIPVLCDAQMVPIKRNFVHVEDLVDAIKISLEHPEADQETYHICMDEPVDYQKVADYLEKRRNLKSVKIPSSCHSTWLDNSKAKFRLGWRPKYDLERLIEEAWSFERRSEDPRIVYYPG